MKKLLILMPTLVLGMMFITSCSSDDNATMSDEDRLKELASKYMDNVEVSLLEGAWEEQGYYVTSNTGEWVNAHAGNKFLPLRLNFGKDNIVTEYFSYFGQDEAYLIRTDRKYEYDPETRTFFVVNPLLPSRHHVIDYLSDDYLTLSYTAYGVSTKYVLKRMDEATVAEWNKKFKPEYRGNIAEYGVSVEEDNKVSFTDPSLLMSESQFKEIFVGRKLQHVETHKIEADGRICEMDYYLTVEGGSADDFLFEDEQCHVMGYSIADPATAGPFDHIYTYKYDEACNTINGIFPILTLLKYDAKTEEATFLSTPFKLLEIFKLMPKE